MDSGFDILEKLLNATRLRHRVITSNIANADTPNYRAKDVDFGKILDESAAELRATDPRHIRGAGGRVEAGEGSAEPSLSWGDRNNVELDMEIAKMTENGLLHETGVRLLSVKMRMIRNAAKGR